MIPVILSYEIQVLILNALNVVTSWHVFSTYWVIFLIKCHIQKSSEMSPSSKNQNLLIHLPYCEMFVKVFRKLAKWQVTLSTLFFYKSFSSSSLLPQSTFSRNSSPWLSRFFCKFLSNVKTQTNSLEEGPHSSWHVTGPSVNEKKARPTPPENSRLIIYRGPVSSKRFLVWTSQDKFHCFASDTTLAQWVVSLRWWW